MKKESTINRIYSERLSKIWKQNHSPVMLRKGKGHQLMIKLPYADDTYDWLRNERRSKPKWNGQYKCWELPQAWFNDLVVRILSRHGKLYIIQPYRQQEICARPAGARKVMNASAPVWVKTMVRKARAGIGSQCQRPLPPCGMTASSCAV